MPLISLKDHNSSRWPINVFDNSPRLNGIACPKCGAEMLDSSPNVILTSMPAQKRVNCSACDYQGFALA